MSTEEGNTMGAAPETPINVKRQQIRQQFMSPTDNMFSPCTAKLMGNKSKNMKPRGLLHQAFKKNMQGPLVTDKENTPDTENSETPNA